MRFKRETVSITHPAVAADLAAACDRAVRHRMRIILEDILPGKKKTLRVHRARDGRFYVMTGFRGHDRNYLSDRCTLITFDTGSPIITYRLEMFDRATRKVEAMSEDARDAAVAVIVASLGNEQRAAA